MANKKLLKFLFTFIIILLLPMSSYSNNKLTPDKTAITAKVAKPELPVIENKGKPAGKNLSVERLKQSNWWSQVQKSISEQEYHITLQKKADAKGQAYQAPNRAQSLRTYFNPERG